MDAIQALIVLIVLIIIPLLFYFIPTMIALQRSHHQTMAIVLLNVFTGWTFVGWIAALVWAATAVKRRNADGTLIA